MREGFLGSNAGEVKVLRALFEAGLEEMILDYHDLTPVEKKIVKVQNNRREKGVANVTSSLLLLFVLS